MSSFVAAMLTSDYVLHDALRNPAIANLPLLAPCREACGVAEGPHQGADRAKFGADDDVHVQHRVNDV